MKTVDVKEWVDLAARLAAAGPEKYDELLSAMRQIVEAQEEIAQHDGQLFFGGRPRKRYIA